MGVERHRIVIVGSVCDGVPSLLQPEEMDVIENIVLDKSLPLGHVLELGVAYGGTSHIIAHANIDRGHNESLYMVDLMVDGDAYLAMRRLCAIVGDTVKKISNVYFILGDITSLSNMDCCSKFRVAFIDAEHTYDALKFDLAHVIPMMIDSGIMILHDLYSEYPGLLQVWKEIEDGLFPEVEIVEKVEGTSLGILKVKDRY